jgi:enterochelin esterase family protein
MGGGEALTSGLTALDQFAWVGAFSAANLEPFDVNLPSVDSGLTPRPALLWIACGTEDALITANRRLRAWLLERGVEHTGIETPGNHTWMVWRRNLAAFLPLLFRPAKGERAVR